MGGYAGAPPHQVPPPSPGQAVQVDPIKPKLKPPGIKRLKLNCDVLLSTSAFKINLRHYIQARRHAALDHLRPIYSDIVFVGTPKTSGIVRPRPSSTGRLDLDSQLDRLVGPARCCPPRHVIQRIVNPRILS